MKIAIVINELDIRGGTHKQVLRLCEYLMKTNNQIKIYTKRYDKDKTYPGFSAFEIVTPDSELLEKKGKVRSRVLERNLFYKVDKDTDIINIHDNGLTYFMLLCRYHSKAKVIWQINDILGCFCVGNSINQKRGVKNRLYRIYSKFAARSVERITVNVTKNKELVKQCYKRDADILYCGVDRNESLIPHKYEMKNVYNILSTGVFFPYRNYETLIYVIKKLKEQGTQARLDIIGSTELSNDYFQKIQYLINKNDLNDCITIQGQVSESKYNQLYNSADIFMFVNINQSWGLAVFEAMSCGLPVIVSNSVGAIELLHNGVDAIIEEPTDVKKLCEHITKLINDEEFYNNISKNAAMEVKEYTWDKLYSKKLYAIFKEFVEE